MKDPEQMRAALECLVAQKRAYHEAVAKGVLSRLADAVDDPGTAKLSRYHIGTRALRKALRRRRGEV